MARIAVIGGGWYGCHIACTLLDAGHEVTLFERNARLLDGASGNNQFRLHHGYHYPRNFLTRNGSISGFDRFMESYPEFTREVESNIYAVPLLDSIIDFRTYCTIMLGSGLSCREIAEPEYLSNTEGRLWVDERVLLITKAREYFTKRLQGAAQMECELNNSDSDSYHWVIDATWGKFCPLPIEVTYESTLLIYYEARQPFPAITFVDGPLCSIYPTEDPAIYTLSSVTHTPIKSDVSVSLKRYLMEHQISRYIPSFRDIFRFVGPQFSCKTKPVGASDDRACRVFKNGRVISRAFNNVQVISVLSGKIDGIFYAADRVMEMIRD